MNAKIITIEGTDCSGKETQSKKLYNYLIEKGYKVFYTSFPNYDSPTGKIVGGPYLGKEEIHKSLFEEGAVNVDALVASLYFAADRRYNYLKLIKEEIENNDFIILDRYTYSNMAHQGGKIFDALERNKFYEKLENLEFNICELPKPDFTIFLHMPFEEAKELKKNRQFLDEHEKDDKHLKNAEEAYLELSKKYNWIYINCVDENRLKEIEEISKEVISELEKNIK